MALTKPQIQANRLNRELTKKGIKTVKAVSFDGTGSKEIDRECLLLVWKDGQSHDGEFNELLGLIEVAKDAKTLWSASQNS